ncbi:MAG: DUF2946 family protein [Tepidisphaeraceae bacterium]|jgi:hypothetical protein
MNVGGNIFACRPLKKSIAVFLLVFEAAFLNVIVPGHTRGVITLSGKSSAASVADLGCPFCSRPSGKDPKKTPDQKDQSECAICHIAALLTLPPVVDLAPPLLCLAFVIQAPAPMSAPYTRIPLIRHDRAPPFAA